jgi:tetratricopeptide (TPR) repeat protein
MQIILKKNLIMRHFLYVGLVLLFGGLSGCTTTPPPPKKILPPPAPKTLPPPEPVVVETRTSKELFVQAIEELQAGAPDKAKLTLNRLLAIDPDHAEGNKLLPQLDAVPAEILDKEYFQYKTQSGDTLSRIAKRFLNDPYKFYILAKYNDIDVPGHLEVGKTIKIPGKRPLNVPVAHDGEADTSEKLSEAKALYESKRYQDAINLLEATLREDGASAELREFLITVYVDYSAALAGSGHLADAKTLIAKELVAYPDNRRLRNQAELLARQVNVEHAYQTGLAAIKSGNWGKAYDSFVTVLEAIPAHQEAKARLKEIRPKVIEYFHRNATQAYRKQNMDAAISNWDKVLEIDPQNSLAKSNRARAIELKEHLNKLSQ